jgi:maltose alpha-D-glucosyltransferase/alpha-amylase
MDPVYGYQSVNVEAQQRYESSLLNWMKQTIHVRKRHKVFGLGSLRFIKPENRKILAFTRSYEDETVLCLYNLSRSAQPVLLKLAEYKGREPVEMMNDTVFPEIGEGPYQLALGPYAFLWFLLRPTGKK